MFGLAVLAVAGLYLLVSIVVVKSAISHARKNNKSAKRWGWSAALVMYLIPFWDWIPTVAVHQYYCATESGFWVYKTVDQWKKENPGVMETLVHKKGAPSPFHRKGDMTNYADTYFFNSRFNWNVKRRGKLFPNRWRHEQELVDTLSQEVLARYVDFSTSQEAPSAGWSGWKFWLSNDHCPSGQGNDSHMWLFTKTFKGDEK